jgi:hypothetical protein
MFTAKKLPPLPVPHESGGRGPGLRERILFRIKQPFVAASVFAEMFWRGINGPKEEGCDPA